MTGEHSPGSHNESCTRKLPGVGAPRPRKRMNCDLGLRLVGGRGQNQYSNNRKSPELVSGITHTPFTDEKREAQGWGALRSE